MLPGITRDLVLGSNGTEFRVEVRDRPSGHPIVRVTGDVDAVTAPVLGAHLSECVLGAGTVVLDLREAGFVGCAGLAVIDAAATFLRARGAVLAVACERSVRRGLEVSGVCRRVTFVSL